MPPYGNGIFGVALWSSMKHIYLNAYKFPTWKIARFPNWIPRPFLPVNGITGTDRVSKIILTTNEHLL